MFILLQSRLLLHTKCCFSLPLTRQVEWRVVWILHNPTLRFSPFRVIKENTLIPHENSQQNYPLKSEECQPYIKHPSPEHQCQEKKTPQHLSVKIYRDSVHSIEMEGSWNPRNSLKEATNRLTACRYSPWTLVVGQGFRRCQDTQGKTKLCVFGIRATEKVTIVTVLSPPLTQLAGEHHLSCIEPCPHSTKSEYALA